MCGHNNKYNWNKYINDYYFQFIVCAYLRISHYLITISCLACSLLQINIIGSIVKTIFTGEVQNTLRVLDGGILTFTGRQLPEEYKSVDQHMDSYQMPRLIFIDELHLSTTKPWKLVDMVNTLTVVLFQ